MASQGDSSPGVDQVQLRSTLAWCLLCGPSHHIACSTLRAHKHEGEPHSLTKHTMGHSPALRLTFLTVYMEDSEFLGGMKI